MGRAGVPSAQKSSIGGSPITAGRIVYRILIFADSVYIVPFESSSLADLCFCQLSAHGRWVPCMYR